MGLIAGDHIHALYGFKNGVTATFESRRNQSDSGGRFGLQIWGSEGIMLVYNGSQQIRIYEAPFWRPDYDAPVRDFTSEAIAALPPDERPTIDLQMAANVAIVRDVLKAREEGREPTNSGRDGRWALEMIHGVYASHLSDKRVALPLTNREHPLA
jgi:predicted dehydrogenase